MRCTEPMEPVQAAGRVAVERAGDAAPYAADVARIHNLAYAADASFRPYSPEEMALVLDDYELWIVSADSQLAGFCLVEPEHDTLWIEFDCGRSGMAGARARQDAVVSRARCPRRVRQLSMLAERLQQESDGVVDVPAPRLQAAA